MMTRILSLLFFLSLVSKSFAGSPFIWGADGRAEGLQSNGALLSSGQVLDYDGEYNYIKNNNGYKGGWAANGASVVGASTNTASEIPLYPVLNYAIKFTSSGVGSGYRWQRFVLAKTDINQDFKVCWHQLSGGGYASGNLTFRVFTDDNPNYTSPTELFTVAIPDGTQRFCHQFTTHASEEYYEVRVTRASGGASVWISLNRIFFGKSQITNSDIQNNANIAYSKLNLSNSIVNADVNSSAAISGSKITPTFGPQLVSTEDAYQGEEISTPTTPNTNNRKIYAKTDGWYDLNSSGTEKKLAFDENTHEINLIPNPIPVVNTSGWSSATNYTIAKDTTQDLLKPEVNANFALSTTTASSESSTSGISVSPLVPPLLRNVSNKIEFYAVVPSSSDGVWRLSVYNGSGSRIPLNTDDINGVTTLPDGYSGKFSAVFITDDSTSISIRLTQTTRTNANTLYITNVIVGSGIQPTGAALGPWESWTPILANVGSIAPTYSTALMRRNGSNLDIIVQFSAAGTGANGAFAVLLPNGLTVDSRVTYGSNNNPVLGDAVLYNGTNRIAHGAVRNSDGTGLWFYNNMSSSGGALQGTGINSGNFFGVNASIPIAEWAGSGTVNLGSNDVEYAFNTSGITAAGATNTTAFGYGPQGALIGSIASTTGGSSQTVMRVRFTKPIQPTDLIVLEVDSGTNGASWVEVPNAYMTNTMFQSTSIYGVSPSIVNSTDVDVFFGNRGRFSSNSTYAGDGSTWAGVSTWRWRVKKISGGQAVGFGLASATQTGLVGTGAQTFAGNKTFSENLRVTGSIGTYTANYALAASPAKTTVGYTLQDGGTYMVYVTRYSGSSASAYVAIVTQRGDAMLIYPILDSSVLGIDETTAGSGILRVFSKTTATPNVSVNITKIGEF